MKQQRYEQEYYTNQHDGYRGYTTQTDGIAHDPTASQQQQWYVPPTMDTSSAQSSTYDADADSRIMACASYMCFWLTGLLFLLFTKKRRLVRFHAMQSLLFFGGVTVLYFVFITIMVQQTPFLFGFAIFAFVVMNITAVVAWFVGMYGALKGRYVKLPFVGDIAERYVNNDAQVK